MSIRRCLPPFRQRQVDCNQYAEFFNFTRGRFVCNENEEMARRHISFDMNELRKAAGASVGRKCVKVEKYADGLYNKAFLLTMDNDEQIVAKVPNPNAGLPHLTTASEVATMDLMRNVLETPVPRVLAWHSNIENAVKAEYIIMEKAKGVQLSAMLPSMNFDQKVSVMKSIAQYQKAWARLSFKRIGSLYHAEDLRPDQTSPVHIDNAKQPIPDSRFAIGPIVGREWSDTGKAGLSCERGPWPTNESYRRAMIEREAQAVKSLRPLPKPTTMLCGPSLYQSTPEKKLWACEAAAKALHDILPQGQWTSTYHLWHDDLHDENIFVDAMDPSEIVSIIDWQSSFVAPLFDHIIMPAFLNHDGPPVNGMDRPSPPDLLNMDSDEASAAIKVYDQQLLVSGFKFLLQSTIPAVLEAQLYEESEESNVLNAMRNIYESGEGTCLVSLADSDKSSVQFSQHELDGIREDAEKIVASLRVMDTIKNALGDLFPEKGIVRRDQYEDTKIALRNVKAQVIEDFSSSQEDRRAWVEAWPFDD